MSKTTVETIQALLDAKVNDMTPSLAYEVVNATLSIMDETTETWGELDIVARWLKKMEEAQ